MATDLELATVKHRYAFGGDPLPSVTTITGLLDSNGKSSRMAGAAVKLTKQGLNYRKEWNDKMYRGTRVHNSLDRWLRGLDAEVEPGDQGFMDAAEKYLIDHPLERPHVERIVVGDGWGGRLDTCGESLIEDWKTGSEREQHVIQMAAYANGRGFALYDGSGAFTGIEPMPYITDARCVYLQEDGSYHKVDYSHAELIAAYAAFEGLLAVHRWMKGREAA